uniref:Uncharacterized protein n=1 Tax=Arundo donax TaxID=35708 RepID=A0A0A8XXD1_ARUDO
MKVFFGGNCLCHDKAWIFRQNA